MPAYGYAILLVGWLVWFLPFPITRWNRSTPQRRDPRARWGLILQGISYACPWQGHFWISPPAPWRLALGVLFLALAAGLSWTATRALGRHLRFDAALSPDHQLVRSGPYRFLRHPIYASMLCLLLGTCFMFAPPILFAIAIVIFIVGTEIRVRIEDNLLASHFGGEFNSYQHQVSAYIPFIR